MTAMAGPRKTISIHDYPEHLNPFREEDNHNKIRFWTIGRKFSRSNSISFSGIKDLRNSWSLRSFMKKGKKSESQGSKPTNHVNGDHSPIVYRRALQYSSAASGARSTVGSPERADRYVYGGSITPLPRSRFQERLRSSQPEGNSPSATPRMARSDITGSRLSVESANPFEEAPIPPVRASRRKKKKAPAPPSTSNADDLVTENLELRITESEDAKKSDLKVDDDIEEMNLNKVELKIVEDVEKPIVEHKLDHDTSQLSIEEVKDDTIMHNAERYETKEINVVKTQGSEEITESKPDSESEVVSSISFPKVDISRYRRNSSVNEDEIRLRRGNLEDFHSLAPNKRSKSLSHTLDGSFVAYHTNLNESKNVDINSNEEPRKVVCKVYDDDSRKKSIDNSISSTEKEFLEIDKATRELEREISKLNSALIEDELTFDNNTRLSVSEIRQKFDKPDTHSPNPIPKPRRSHYGESNSPLNGSMPA